MKRVLGDAEWREPWLEQRAALSPEAVAWVLDGVEVRYGELARDVRLLAKKLRDLGVGRGDVVAALFDNGEELPLLLWALREVGAVLLPLNTRLVGEELAHILTDSGARWLFHGDGEYADRARAAARDTGVPICVEMCGCKLQEAIGGRGGIERRAGEGAPRPELSDIMALLYTSGTTGLPKGALIPASAFFASARASAALLGSREDERWLVCMPLFHVGGLSILTRSLLGGSTALIQRRFDPEEVSRALDRDGVTAISLVATMLSRLLEMRGEQRAPPGLRCVLLGGGPAPSALLERARALGYPLAPSYGLTEATSQVATRIFPTGDVFNEDVSSGAVTSRDALDGELSRADSADTELSRGDSPLEARLEVLPGTRVQVVDESGAPLPAGAVGEICVSGPTLMRGYLGRPEATARALRGGWLHTGDVGVLDGEGRLRVLDRRDDLIVSGGENVYPAEIEAVLEAHPDVLEAAVVAEPDPEYGAHPVAFWVAIFPDANAPDLGAWCNERLAAFKQPRSFRRLEALPRNAGGKLLRRRLREVGGAAPRP